MKRKKVFGFKFKGKQYKIKDYIACESFLSKARGLMFRRKNFSKPLVFIFSKPVKMSIHSLFCREFLAVWMLNDKIVDAKVIKPFKLNIVPKKNFNYLIEIPILSSGQANI